MNSEKPRQQLITINHLHHILDNSRIDHWLIGGWAVDFHVTRITREHDDIDLAVWLNNMPRIDKLLTLDGWKRAPKKDEDGGTGYEKDHVRLELTYLVRADDGSIHTPVRAGPVNWPRDALEDKILQLGSARCRVASLSSIKHSKSSPRSDPDDAKKDRADHTVLSEI